MLAPQSYYNGQQLRETGVSHKRNHFWTAPAEAQRKIIKLELCRFCAAEVTATHSGLVFHHCR